VTNEDTPQLWGTPPDWYPPQVPSTWQAPKSKVDWGEPPFDKVDNPGGWSDYTYQAVYNKDKKKYLYHAMPSGATVVPKDAVSGKQELNGYEFFYNGWQHPFPDATNHQNGATKEDLFPDYRESTRSIYARWDSLRSECRNAMLCSSINYSCLLLMEQSQGYPMTAGLVFTRQWPG
jgi:hypothetical protein